ncbi:MAG: lysine--tRNA ligase [Patescibacteria group bacterium]
MFWADKVAKEIIDSGKYTPYWVDDMKTPSGRIHVGSLFGVVFHDLVYRALKDQGVAAKYTYVFENHDPMDDIPSYLPREKFEKYLGMPLFRVPSPLEGYKDYAEYYALEFKKAFNQIGSYPEIIWTKDLYTSGKMNTGVKKALDNASEIRSIYQQMYKKEMPADWYPFQVYCESCGKVSTTRVYDWDGEFVHYRCPVDATEWTKGCGHEGKTSPFSDENGIKGKMPWKIEWACKWQAIGVTVEGAGKDHMSKGGSHDLTSLIAKKVLDYPVPYPVSYEFMLIGGKKMSSSKGRGFSAGDMLSILPAELVRFLIVKMDIKQQTNFDPTEKDTIPNLFDAYQKAAAAYFDKTDEDLARTFELSQIGDIVKPPSIRFSVLAQWVQMPNMQDKIKEEGLEEWAKYARVWIEKYAPDSAKFLVQKDTPEGAKHLSAEQKELLQKIVAELDKEWNADDLQTQIYELGKPLGLNGKQTFSAIYQSLIGKDHGPKAAWFILSLEKDFVQKRFNDVILGTSESEDSRIENKDSGRAPLARMTGISSNIFSIDKNVKEKHPSISIGIAVIKGVTISKTNPELEKEKEKLLDSLKGLTTEKIGEYLEVLSYRKLYKAMGIDWHSRRPSPEALLRRVAQGKDLYTINTCVDAYNLVVMRHRISIGAFDLDTLQFPTELRFAKAGEEILLLGDTESTKYKETELSYFDQQGGYNIDFNFRDSQRTAVTEQTKNIYLNVDGIDEITPEQVRKSLQESCDLITTYCGGEVLEFGLVTR